MISRVGAALHQFIKPITGAGDQARVQPKERQFPFQDDLSKKKNKKENEKAPSSNKQSKVNVIKANLPIASNTAPAESIAQTFLKILTTFQHQIGALVKRHGLQTYHYHLKKKKNTNQLRKGAMLDERVG